MSVKSLGTESSLQQQGGTLRPGVLATPASEDADATAFFTATSITDATQKDAVNRLTFALKYYGLWSKIKALYPFVGGTATTHMYNLKDPQNTNAAFRLTFSGGWTHTADGAECNGTNAYADTFVNISTSITSWATSHHIAIYNRTATPTGGGWYAACGDTTTGNPFWGMGFRATPYSDLSAIVYYDSGNTTSGGAFGRAIASFTNRSGPIIGSTLSTSDHKAYINGNLCINNTQTTSGTVSNLNLWLGAINASPGSVFYNGLQFAFASIGDGLTTAECARLTQIIEMYQAVLGRGV